MEVPPTDPAVVDQLRTTFERIAGSDAEIDAYELKEILNAAFGSGKCVQYWCNLHVSYLLYYCG